MEEMKNQSEVVVVTASDLNEKYVSCVPWFIEFWLSQRSSIENLVFTPLVLIIADKLPESLIAYEKYCKVITSDLPSAFVAQNVRTLYSGLVSSEYVVTSDIDMLPMNSKLIDIAFVEANKSPKTAFVVLRDVLPEGQYPICYSLGSPNVWSRITGVSTQQVLLEKLQELFNTLNSEEYAGRHGGYGWFIDQEYLYESVTKAEMKNEIDVVKLKDTQTGHRRLDRIYHRGLIKWMVIPRIRRNVYSDYHVHHPVSKNSNYLNKLLKIKQS